MDVGDKHHKPEKDQGKGKRKGGRKGKGKMMKKQCWRARRSWGSGVEEKEGRNESGGEGR